jgi:phospholipase C
VYASADGNFGDNVLPYFQQYWTDPALVANAFVPSFPGDFETDCATGNLPQVSWILAPLLDSEHPPGPVEWGQWASSTAFRALTHNPSVWAKSVLFITHDENGGFFDHVPPPTAPAGASGEYLTVSPLPSAASGIAGPIGLGFRVPLLIASPFARGGLVCSDVFDHTSTLRFIESRFGAEVPNLSSWRRSVTGDLTSAFNFAQVRTSVPALPQPDLKDPRVWASTCATSAPFDLLTATSATLAQIFGTFVQDYPIPPNGGIPPQEPGTARRPSGPVPCPT